MVQNLGLSQKTLCHPWCLKLVMGLHMLHVKYAGLLFITQQS